MKIRKSIRSIGRFLCVILISTSVNAQLTDTASYRLLAPDSSKAGLTTNDSTSDGMKLNVKSYSLLFIDNFKRQALFPFYLKGNDWLKFAGYALVTGASAFGNEPVKRYSIKLHNTSSLVDNTSKYVTRFGGPYAGYTLAGLFTYSALTKNQKLKTTTLLASQAYIISNFVGGGVKALTSVQGPFYVDPISGKTGPIFHGPFYTLKKGPDGKKLKSTNYVSFPSGHTYSAFSIATVFAMEYKNTPMVPIVCYTAATLVGLSRLTENRHWVMDIIAGGLVGYYSGKQVVNNYHRTSKRKALNKIRRDISLNMQYVNDQIIPGMVYRF